MFKDRECTFIFKIEDKGNWVEKTAKGKAISDMYLKNGQDKEGRNYEMRMVMVEAEDGQVHEVFATSIKFLKK